VMHAMLEYRATVLRTAWPDASVALSARIANDADALQTPQEHRPKSREGSRSS
jgi:hypothetical protein